jgi:hypothetical protein
MKPVLITLFGVMGVMIFLIFPGRASAHHTTLKQQILPIDCIFETINDGLNTINYLTPAECGVIVPPVTEPTEPTPTDRVVIPRTRIASRTPVATNGGIGHVSSPLAPQESNRQLLLNNIIDTMGKEGYLVHVREGDVLFYRPLDSPQAVVRSIIIKKIGPESKTMQIDIGGLDLTLTLHIFSTQHFDKLQNGEPAVSVRLESVQKSEATLRIRLLKATPVASRQPDRKLQLTVIAALVGFGILLRLMPHWTGNKKPTA